MSKEDFIRLGITLERLQKELDALDEEMGCLMARLDVCETEYKAKGDLYRTAMKVFRMEEVA